MAASKSPGIRREFLGWDKPALPEAARMLAERYADVQTLDLAQVTIVVPGQRAGRRLQELLAFLAHDRQLLFTPPQVVTEGKLPEMLYLPQKPFASDLVQDLVWAQALRELPAEERRHVVPHPPGDGEAVRWMALGKVLRQLHRELAADGKNFMSVLTCGPKLADFGETERWRALDRLQAHYHSLLDAQQLWDKQTARLVAIDKKEIATERDIILLGTVDLNDTLRKMLDQVADRVTAYVVAPKNLADHFDDHGCLKPDAWADAPMPLKDEQLIQVDGPEDQANAVTDWLTEMAGRRSKDQIVIGVPDDALVPQLQRQIEQCDEEDLERKAPPRPLKARWVEGARLAETAPYRLLATALSFAGAGRYNDLASLIRHLDIERWLRDKGWPASSSEAQSLPAQLDRYYNARLPSRIQAAQMLVDDDWPDLPASVRCVEQWLVKATAPRRLRDWADVFRELLNGIYGQWTLNLADPAADAFCRTIEKIKTAYEGLREVPESLDAASVGPADAFTITFGPLAAETLPPPADPDAIEILGWLELPLDDAPALVVTSFNEGFVPKSAGADAFLPDRLRCELNLLHNERRYARDAYAASVLCHSRAELRIVVARRDAKKDPLHPSRLLFACAEETMIARTRRFFNKTAPVAGARRLMLAPRDANVTIPTESAFRPPMVRPRAKPARMSVTRFKDYLACPYRFYLRHVCELEAIDDAARELDGGAFGTLLHRVLSAFGRNRAAPRGSDNAQRIHDFLLEELMRAAAELYGADQRRPAIRFQLEQARERLAVFAAKQAELVRDGWQIVYVEDDSPTGRLTAPFLSDAGEVLMELVGRIDRIDYHEGLGTYRILDYKTADNAVQPDKSHYHKKNGWTDLQLPLYRHLATAPIAAVSGNVKRGIKMELGYFNLPKELAETGFVMATWDDATLRQADAVAESVIRKLLANTEDTFMPITRPAPRYSDDFAAICLDRHLSGPDLGDGDNGEGGSA